MFIPRRLNHKGQMFGFVKFGGVLKELEKKNLMPFGSQIGKCKKIDRIT